MQLCTAVGIGNKFAVSPLRTHRRSLPLSKPTNLTLTPPRRSPNHPVLTLRTNWTIAPRMQSIMIRSAGNVRSYKDSSLASSGAEPIAVVYTVKLSKTAGCRDGTAALRPAIDRAYCGAGCNTCGARTSTVPTLHTHTKIPQNNGISLSDNYPLSGRYS